MKTIKLFVIFFLFGLLINSCKTGGDSIHKEKSKPNIIWIFSDDHSYQTIGAYGGRLQELNPTPNIDKLAAEGMRFNRCYVENSILMERCRALTTGKSLLVRDHNKAPHRAWVPKRVYMQMYEDLSIPEPANLHDDYATRTTATQKQASMTALLAGTKNIKTRTSPQKTRN